MDIDKLQKMTKSELIDALLFVSRRVSELREEASGKPWASDGYSHALDRIADVLGAV